MDGPTLNPVKVTSQPTTTHQCYHSMPGSCSPGLCNDATTLYLSNQAIPLHTVLSSATTLNWNICKETRYGKRRLLIGRVAWLLLTG